jgi:hypothetical protein
MHEGVRKVLPEDPHAPHITHLLLIFLFSGLCQHSSGGVLHQTGFDIISYIFFCFLHLSWSSVGSREIARRLEGAVSAHFVLILLARSFLCFLLLFSENLFLL